MFRKFGGLFRESGDADAGNANHGFLVDNIDLTSSPTPSRPLDFICFPPSAPPTSSAAQRSRRRRPAASVRST
jgi:hypothetical protein